MTLILVAFLIARLPASDVAFEPATKVIVTVAGAAPVERYFVRVDEDTLTVLNLSLSGLPKRQLLAMTVDHPDWMAATWRTTYKDGGLLVGPDGVVAKGKKLADLDRVVERIPRARLKSIEKP